MIDGKDNPSIKLLDFDLQDFVHAYQSISTFHSAIEEVISNSIDANSTEIIVYIDLDKFSFEVHDNGVGIVYENLISIGGWNQSSKHIHDRKTYGCKGEALSALRQICQHLDIYTVPYGQRKDIYHKNLSLSTSQKHSNDNFNQENSIHILRNDIDQTNIFNYEHGTVVKVVGLFHNLPVRRNSIKPEIELNHIKEYVQRIGVLHHHIAWSIYNVSSSSSSTKRDNCYVRSLYLPIENSVLHRLFSIHTNVATTLYNLEKVHCTYDGCSISGLLSPPLASCCHWNKEYQYGYINQRWLRNMDIISNYINQCYDSILDSNVGMSSRNYITVEDASYSPSRTSSRTSSRVSTNKVATFNNHRFPCFVLQVTCDTEEYDVLVEPDKSTIIFRNEMKLIRCLYNLMIYLFEKHLTKQDLSRFIQEEEMKYSNRGGFITSNSINTTHTSNHRANNTEATTRSLNQCFTEFSCQQDALDHASPRCIIQDMYTIENNSSGGVANDVPTTTTTTTTNNVTVTATSTSANDMYYSPATQSRLFNKAFFIHTPSASVSMIPPALTATAAIDISNKHTFSFPSQHLKRSDYFKDSPYSPPTVMTYSEEQIMKQHLNTIPTDTTNTTPFTQSSLKNMIVDVIERNNEYKRDENEYQKLKRSRSVLNEFDDEVILKYNSELHPLVMFESEVSVHVKKVSKAVESDTTSYNARIPSSPSSFLKDEATPTTIELTPVNNATIQSQDIEYATSPLYKSLVLERENKKILHSNDDDEDTVVQLDALVCTKKTLNEPAEPHCFMKSFNNDFIANNTLSSSNIPKKNSSNDNVFSKCNMNQDIISLNKGYLNGNLMLVGQADHRYILAHCCNNAVDDDIILAFDQHAVDERIRYEYYHNYLTNMLFTLQQDEASYHESYNIGLEKDLIFKVVLVSYTMELNYKEYNILYTRANVLNTWMISYQAYKSNHLSSESMAEQFTLIVHKVPEIFGIRLLPADIREFIHYLICNSELPDSLLKPPVLIRILASKSCRGAVKFGEILTQTQLENMLTQLLSCNFPFQCAHGRPSMVPIVDLKPLYTLKIIELQCNSYSLL